MDVTQQAYSIWIEKVKCVFPTMLTRWVHYPFPLTPMKKRKLLLQSVNIYCKCWLPYIIKHKKKKLVNKQDDIKMVYCDCCLNWYHFKYLHVDGKGACSITHDEKEWNCDDCAKEFIFR